MVSPSTLAATPAPPSTLAGSVTGLPARRPFASVIGRARAKTAPTPEPRSVRAALGARLAHEATPLREPLDGPRRPPDGPEGPEDPHAVTRARRSRAEPPMDAADALDPTVRALAALAPPRPASCLAAPMPVPVPLGDALAREVHALALATLERAAFWGDGRQGVARLRFGARARGGLAGTTVTLEVTDGRVAVRVEGDDEAADALTARLRAAGMDVD